MIEVLTKASEYGFTQGVLGVWAVLMTMAAIFFYLRLEKARADHMADTKELVKVVVQNTEALDGSKEMVKDIADAQESRTRIAAELVQSHNNLKERFDLHVGSIQGQLNRIESKPHA